MYREIDFDKETMNSNFIEKIDLENFQKSMEYFTNIFDLEVELVDLEGNIILEVRDESICKFHRNNRDFSKNCYLDYFSKKLSLDSELVRKIHIESFEYDLCICKNYITYVKVPLYVKGKKIANLLIRGLFLEDYNNKREIISNWESKGLKGNIEAINKKKVLSNQELENIIIYLKTIAELVGNMAFSKKKDDILQVEIRSSYDELNASYEELLAIEEELRDQYEKLQEKDRKLRDSEERYKNLYVNMNDGLALHEIVFDSKGQAVDYIFLDVNNSFEKLTGLKKEDILGKRVLDILPETENFWIKKYGEVVKNNSPMEIENYSKELKKYYNVKAYPMSKNRFATLISDISERKAIEKKVKKSLLQTVESLGQLVELRDSYTSGHQKRVALIAKNIALEMNLSESQVESIYIAGLLHDIGKISIPSEILNKPTRLINEEFNLIKVHSRSGYEVLKNIDFPWDIAEIVLQHHERIDGSGYPRGLIGEEICIEAKILTVADVVEAISSHRPYRPSLGIEFAIEELERNKGTYYDDYIIDVFVRLYRENKFPKELFNEKTSGL